MDNEVSSTNLESVGKRKVAAHLSPISRKKPKRKSAPRKTETKR